MPHDRHVLGGVVLAQTAGVLAKGDVQDPVQTVLNSPMTANRTRKLASIGRNPRTQAAQEVTHLGSDDRTYANISSSHKTNHFGCTSRRLLLTSFRRLFLLH